MIYEEITGLKGNAYQIKIALKDRICLSNQLTANFIKISHQMMKLYACEGSIISLKDAAIFISFWNHNLFIFSKMKMKDLPYIFCSILM